MKFVFLLGGAILLALLWSAPQGWAKDPEYIGAVGCTSKCHKKDDEGDQRSVWEKNKHAEAFKNLGTAEAKKRAKTVGMTGDPQKSEACLVCHVTAYGQDKAHLGPKYDMEMGVQCESCHGPGGDYSKKKTMLEITRERGADRKGESATAKKVGLIFPNEKTCTRCHAQEITFNGKTYKNPSYKEFDFKERFDKIKHPIPEARLKQVIESGQD